MYIPAAETRLPAGAASRRKLLAQVWATKTPRAGNRQPQSYNPQRGNQRQADPYDACGYGRDHSVRAALLAPETSLQPAL